MRHMGWLGAEGVAGDSPLHYIGLDGKSLCGGLVVGDEVRVTDEPGRDHRCEGCESRLSAYLTANRYQVAEEQEDGSLRPLEAFANPKDAEIRLCHLCYGEADADVYLIDVFEAMEGLLA
ncbi:hypothetical protein R2R70_02120 [Cobetia sp. SIMBA_158]|uniref:hypothetical protein n=1 Tax=Cobetia sp. SIMBA_158 TaxID=3081617 RepID=UPI00397EDA79